MTTNLRVSLTILSAGFAIEGGAELYSFVSRGTFRPGVSLLLVLPFAATLVGLLFVWVGQHEWNALHRARVRRAHLIFGLSLLGALVAGGTVALLTAVPSLGTPPWTRALFGVAVGSLVFGTFVTYATLVFHLVGRPSQALLLAALLWALVVAAFVGAALAASLPTLVDLAVRRTLSVPSFLGPVSSLASYLFVSYFLLFAAYVLAHQAVARGPGARPGGPTGRAPGTEPGSPGAPADRAGQQDSSDPA